MQHEDWDDLRYFLAVAEHGSLTAAARALSVHPSTVFRRVAQLEDRLGARLFERRTRGTALTGTGERMLPLARRIHRDVDALHRAMDGADGLLEGAVRVTTVLELFQLLAPWFATFHRIFPGIDIEVSTDPRVASLQRNEADVALRPGLAPTEPDVIGRRLAPLGLAVFAAPAYVASRGGPASVDELGGHDWVAFRPASGRDEPCLGDSRAVAWVDRRLAQVAAIRAGWGLATLPVFMAHDDPSLVRLFDVPSDDALHLWLLFHRDLRRSARLRAFTDFIEARVADHAHQLR